VDENNPNTYALGDKEKSATEYQKAKLNIPILGTNVMDVKMF